ncbi:hypothetical protein Ahy_B05g077967 [Arachis hypogaea]|uniref:Uncharacterized protein n=1 Tax=Arachis hypogaea TaxID=3818 RepID=A0A444Z5Z8_ARAHY|nr:hypothetical protein Ahy_B05g077967 [Arachis hypogaea]
MAMMMITLMRQIPTYCCRWRFVIGMEFSYKEIVIAAIKNYTICRGVNYRVYESEPTTFYAKCDHCKLDSNTIVEAIKSLVEADPSLKVQYVTADDQAKFYTMSYPKA